MTTSIRDTYLQAAAQLELTDLLAVDSKNNEVYARNITGFKSLTYLYDKTIEQLNGTELEEVKKVHAQVGFLFLEPGTMPTKPYFEAKRIHYLRIVLEQDQTKLVRKYFRTLSIEQRRSAFKMLCDTFGRPLIGEKTSKNGIYHIAKDPRNLLAPATSVTGSPRIIDVLLQKQLVSCSAAPKPATLDSSATESDESEYIVDTWGKRTLKPIDSKKKILDFYLNLGVKNDYGQTRDQMLMRSNEELLTLKEKEIRWLFPLSKDIDNFSLYEDFKPDRDRTRIDNLKLSFMRMLGAYGLALDLSKKTINRDPGTTILEFVKLWQTPNAPHHQHIERILACLRSFDSFLADAFLETLEQIYRNEGKGAISESTHLAWIRAAIN